MSKRNDELRSAAKNKKDEFYTQYSDIEKEMIHYKDYFKDKIVYCNCDDFHSSQFVAYFKNNFKELGLKYLYATGMSVNGSNESYYFGYDGEFIVRDVINHRKYGDFTSNECLINKSDIVVTNPPFSMFREFIKLMFTFDKKFIVLGQVSSILCKEIFPYVRDNKMWIGPSIHSGDRLFRVPDDYPLNASNCVEKDGEKFIRVKGIRWFTNIVSDSMNEPLELTVSSLNNHYETFDNIPCVININSCKEIPKDYYGFMGVPVTFIDKYCPEQFEIVDVTNRYTVMDYFGVNDDVKQRKSHCSNVNGKTLFSRIIIKRR